jgi:hypothetical protein
MNWEPAFQLSFSTTGAFISAFLSKCGAIARLWLERGIDAAPL